MLSWIQPLIPRAAPMPDWFTDARRLTMGELSIFKLMKQLWRSDWGEGKDGMSFDSTFEGALRLDERWHDPGPNTYYRSYVACMVSRISIHVSAAKVDTTHALCVDKAGKASVSVSCPLVQNSPPGIDIPLHLFRYRWRIRLSHHKTLALFSQTWITTSPDSRPSPNSVRTIVKT